MASYSRFQINGEKTSSIFILADLLIASVMAAYTEMVNAQLGLLNKQFILILNGRFNSIYLSRD